MTPVRPNPTLDETHPDLAAEMLPPFDPRLFRADSTVTAWWRGPLGHVWSASVSDRTRGVGCPVCSGLHQPSSGRSLQEVAPAAAMDADGWAPDQVSAGSRVEMPWRCHDCGTSWTAEIRARAHGYRPCPTCSSSASPSLSITHPELASQMVAPFDPDDYTHGSKARVRWRGPVGHEWDATIANRVKGSGCPVCSHGAGGRSRQTPQPGAVTRRPLPRRSRPRQRVGTPCSTRPSPAPDSRGGAPPAVTNGAPPSMRARSARGALPAREHVDARPDAPLHICGSS